MSDEGPDTLYSLLGVAEDATDAQLKKAYREAAKMYHPDVNPEAEPGKFGKIAEAYDVLSDPSKRRMYDASLSFKWDGGREGTQRGGGNSAGDGWTEGEWQEFFYRRGTNPDGGYGRYAESDLKRRAREAQEAAQRAEDEKAWWEFEKTHAERMKVQFRVNAARARGSHAKLGGFWQTRSGILWMDVAVTAAAVGFVLGAGTLFIATGPPPPPSSSSSSSSPSSPAVERSGVEVTTDARRGDAMPSAQAASSRVAVTASGSPPSEKV